MFGSGFYNPYMYQPYYQTANIARGLGGVANASRVGSTLASGSAASSMGKSLLGKFSFSGFLNGASKTLNVVNQAIPIFYQVRPMINNAKTMFRIMGAVKSEPSSKVTTNQNIQSNTRNTSATNSIATKSNTYNEPIIEKEIATDNPVFFI